MFGLFTKRNFLPLFITQFGGAMNDNTYKNGFVVLLVYSLAVQQGYDSSLLVNIIQAIFLLPFILFASIAGAVGDSFDKAMIIRRVKLLEIFIVALAILGFYLGNVPLLIFIVFLLSVQSTFFGPVKYSIIADHLADDLVPANALIAAGTFLAIIGGTIAGGYFAAIEGGLNYIYITLIALAFIGYAASYFIPPALPSPTGKQSGRKINYNFITSTVQLLRLVFAERKEFIPLIMGVAWFWFVGSVVIVQIPILTQEFLLLEARSVSVFMLIFACGIGSGSIICSMVLKGKATARFSFVTLLILGLLLIEMSMAMDSLRANLRPAAGAQYISLGEFFANWRAWRLSIDFALMSIIGGCYVLPVFAVIQAKASNEERSRIIASTNISNSLFIVVSAIMTILVYQFLGGLETLFIILGVACILVSFLWLVYIRQPKNKQFVVSVS